MEWLSRCVNSLNISSPPCACPNDCSAACLPPFKTLSLPDIIPATENCAGCTVPCALHPAVVPSTELGIDQSRSLHNTVPGYAIHLIICTGKSDWPAHIEDEGLAQALVEIIHERKKAWKRTEANRFQSPYDTSTEYQRILITNTELPSNFSTRRSAHDVLLMPDNVVIANVTPSRARALLDFIYHRPNAESFQVHPNPYTNLLLVCGHGRKDRRCGTMGPMLKKALDDAISISKADAQVALVSHLGGHAFAGNLVIYTHQGRRVIWYGRVTPCHCMEIIHQSVSQDKVIQDLLRAVFEAGCSRRLDW
ncbi:hypothetical protein K492DRAFT_27289 [Lichtheimia hyalospora FSU 10163]|nr:hypothetical protein K492DRAFT_27289 [Lichtheimia hyalospora FSU 10163]